MIKRIQTAALVMVAFGLGITVGKHWFAPGKTVVQGTSQQRFVQQTAGSPGSEPSRDMSPLDDQWRKLKPEQRAAELDRIFSITDREFRLAEFLVRLRAFDSADVSEALRHMREGDLKGAEFPLEWENLVRQWGRMVGAEAVEKSFERFGSKTRQPERFSNIAMAGWAEQDPVAAVNWLNSHDQEPNWTANFKSLAAGLGRSNPDLAAATVATNLTGDQNANAEIRKTALRLASETVVNQGGLDSLETWYAKIPTDQDSGATRRAAFSEVFNRANHAGLETAQEFLRNHAADQWRSDGDYEQFTANLAQKTSPAQALDWAGSLPPSPSGNWPGAAQVYQGWVKADPAAAEAWKAARADDDFCHKLR